MSNFRRQWLWPIMLGVVTIFGLLAALVGEGGIWWALSWLMLAVPLVVMAYLAWSRREDECSASRRGVSSTASSGG